ncbi:MAG TPA: MBL fold metallo-hydrolase [Acidimicrobiales bacterium]|nr:MBL fold metallo-hydrolase [Acidimicrobiales bacterium]
MRVQLFGVRGSTPASGAEFLRHGGHTSCVGLSHDGAPPSLVLDAGTGLRGLAHALRGAAFLGTIALSHLHWDHVQGLPFFFAADHPDSRITVLIPEQGDPEQVLARAMSPPHFPVRPSELRGVWRFAGLPEGPAELEGFSVLARDIPHSGGRTFGFRVSDGRATIAYLSDHHPLGLGPGRDGLGARHEAALSLADGVDLLVHDAQHVEGEFPAKAYLGHSTVEYAVALAREANARKLLLYHHDPDRTDDEIDAIVAGTDGTASLIVEAAAEGTTIDLPGRGRSE